MSVFEFIRFSNWSEDGLLWIRFIYKRIRKLSRFLRKQNAQLQRFGSEKRNSCGLHESRNTNRKQRKEASKQVQREITKAIKWTARDYVWNLTCISNTTVRNDCNNFYVAFRYASLLSRPLLCTSRYFVWRLVVDLWMRCVGRMYASFIAGYTRKALIRGFSVHEGWWAAVLNKCGSC